MRIEMPPRRPRAESIIPMINVVFLLLVFFLLTAQIAPPSPLAVTLPESAPENGAELPAEARDVLFASADGGLAWNDARDDAVWTAIAAHDWTGPVEIRADAALPAASLAALLARLREASGQGARLVVMRG